MKKKFIILFTIFALLKLCSYDLFQESWYISYSNYDDIQGVMKLEDRIIEINWMERNYSIYDLNSLRINEYGFYQVETNSGEYLLFYSKYGFNHVVPLPVEPGITDSTSLESWDLGFEQVSATSNFVETIDGNTYEYLAENLMKHHVLGPVGSIFFEYNTLPWVEGTEGSGIGETIHIQMEKPISGISILGGFVDPHRQQLFRANNRPSIIRIYTTGEIRFEIEVELPDAVVYTDAFFPNKTSDFYIEIIDVYAGSKWNDTCITALFPLKQSDKKNQRSLESIKNQLENFTLQNGN